MAVAWTMSWVCYILRCADDTLYCGVTNDLDKRLAVHNAGEGAKYTRGRTPVRLAYSEPCVDKSTALKREIEIKDLPRTKKMAMIEAGCKQFGDAVKLEHSICKTSDATAWT